MNDNSSTTAQSRWLNADVAVRNSMLAQINESSSYANKSWSRLPHLVRTNLLSQGN